MVDLETEILVIGGNPGGSCAAISAARSGRRVMLVESTYALGGINANGVFAFDAWTPQALSGIAEEFASRIRAYYRGKGFDDPMFHRRSDQVWESHVAAAVWAELTAETAGLTVHMGLVPIGVDVDDGKIRRVELTQAIDAFGNPPDAPSVSHRIAANVVIDASYEADVTAWAGVPYRIGREARSWHEPHAGRIFTNDLKGSGDYLPNSVLPGSTGEADAAIMAFACRLHCRIYEDRSPRAAHRVRPPPGYDSSRYAWSPVGFRDDGSPLFFNNVYVLVNGKLLLNRMVRGNNLASATRDYILAHPTERKRLRERFVHHALGFLYFIQTKGGLPELGLADDEFVDNGNIPYQIYVREGRRIEARQVLTEADITPYIAGDGFRPPFKASAVAIGDWAIESHGCTDDLEEGHTHPEGWVFNRVARVPFQIPFEALLPAVIDNLLVCGAIGATHVAFSGLRCEAIRIQNGIAAGIAASLAVARQCRPADVPVPALQAEIIARNGKLTYFADVGTDHPHFGAIQWAALRGLTPRDAAWRFFPDHPVDWAEFVRSIVVALRLPISVTGAHFEGIAPRDPVFPYVEALYDLGTREGVDIFNARQLKDEDPLHAILRYDAGPRLIPFVPDAGVDEAGATRFLGLVRRALDPTSRPDSMLGAPSHHPAQRLLTRGRLCAELQRIHEGEALDAIGMQGSAPSPRMS